MKCLQCGTELDRISKWRGSADFCSEECKKKNQDEFNRLAMTRLMQPRQNRAAARPVVSIRTVESGASRMTVVTHAVGASSSPVTEPPEAGFLNEDTPSLSVLERRTPVPLPIAPVPPQIPGAGLSMGDSLLALQRLLAGCRPPMRPALPLPSVARSSMAYPVGFAPPSVLPPVELEWPASLGIRFSVAGFDDLAFRRHTGIGAPSRGTAALAGPQQPGEAAAATVSHQSIPPRRAAIAVPVEACIAIGTEHYLPPPSVSPPRMRIHLPKPVMGPLRPRYAFAPAPEPQQPVIEPVVEPPAPAPAAAQPEPEPEPELQPAAPTPSPAPAVAARPRAGSLSILQEPEAPKPARPVPAPRSKSGSLSILQQAEPEPAPAPAKTKITSLSIVQETAPGPAAEPPAGAKSGRGKHRGAAKSAARDAAKDTPLAEPAPEPAVPAEIEKPPAAVLAEVAAAALEDVPSFAGSSDTPSGGFWARMPAWQKAAGALLAVAIAVGAWAVPALSHPGGSKVPRRSVTPAAPATAPGHMDMSEWMTGAVLDDDGVTHKRMLRTFVHSAGRSDYLFEFTGRIEEAAMSWVFRVKDVHNYYCLRLQTVDGVQQLATFAVVKGKEEAHRTVDLGAPLPAGKPIDVRLDVRGNSFSSWINGKPVDRWVDKRLKSGPAGLATEFGERAVITALKVTY